MSNRITIKDKEFRPYLTNFEIRNAVSNVAAQINNELSDENPLFLIVLNGSFIFAADLIREISIPCEISFIKLASYSGTESSGKMTELIGLKEDVSGRTVVIIEDIVDSGATVDHLTKLLQNKGAQKIMIATALFKPASYKQEIKVDYIGFSIPDDFVVGYGMDYNGAGRNLKDIHVLA